MKRKYQKPMFKRVKGLGFVFRPVRDGWTAVCRLCSSCHGCR